MPFWGNFSLFLILTKTEESYYNLWVTDKLTVVNSNVLIYIRGDLQAPDVTGCDSSFRAAEQEIPGSEPLCARQSLLPSG